MIWILWLVVCGVVVGLRRGRVGGWIILRWGWEVEEWMAGGVIWGALGACLIWGA